MIKKKRTDFFHKLLGEVLFSINNDYSDNYDHYRFGALHDEGTSNPNPIKRFFKNKLKQKGYFHRSNADSVARSILHSDWISDFEYLYNILEDEESREILIKVIAYRLLGHTKVKLPLNTPEYWENIKIIESHQSKNDIIGIDFMNFKLPLTNLEFLGVPMKMYYSAAAINTDFIVKQYDLVRKEVNIKVDKGDVVIDGGGCFGDTALYFVHKTGSSGAVHSFEFIPDNISIWEKNIGLNPHIAPGVFLAKRPLWSVSEIDVYFKSNGPGSKVSFEQFGDSNGVAKTITIDDYVLREQLKKVDFIKLDIEGAELNALKGAIETIRKFKPKLAVALYHSTQDFHDIPVFLEELNIGYRFYISHSTIYDEETMLFASVE